MRTITVQVKLEEIIERDLEEFLDLLDLRVNEELEEKDRGFLLDVAYRATGYNPTFSTIYIEVTATIERSLNNVL